MSYAEALQLYEQYKVAVDQQSNYEKGQQILSKLKLIITKFESYAASFSAGPTNWNNENLKKELQLTREILEAATLLSVKLRDFASFERNIAQVKRFYYDEARYPIPGSERENAILGLELLFLLASNRLADFHTELELLPTSLHQNVFIKHPIQLEQYLMEGAYNKLWNSRADVPADSYIFFMDTLMDTVRNEIAECSEKAYKSLLLVDAQKALNFASQAELVEFAAKRDWEIRDGRVYFLTEEKKKGNTEIPSLKLIHQTLTYAKELERIV